MPMKTNYHTHSNFCDGKASVEEMILDGIESGFDILGFSSHAAYPFESDWHIKLDKYDAYVSCVRSLAEKYKDKIQVMLGFEADYLPIILDPRPELYEKFGADYLIGSVHYVINFDNPSKEGFPQNGCAIPYNCFAIDGTVKEVGQGIINMFDGNGRLAVQSYYALQRDMALFGKFDIIGHPDIIRKRNSILNFFNPADEWYKNEVIATAKAFAKSGKVVEINYGGIPRGTMKDTYPGLGFLKLLCKLNVPVTISADAHDKGQLNNGYDYALKQAKAAGYNEIHYLQDGSWKSYQI